jgi:hypothetical protein
MRRLAERLMRDNPLLRLLTANLEVYKAACPTYPLMEDFYPGDEEDEDY